TVPSPIIRNSASGRCNRLFDSQAYLGPNSNLDRARLTKGERGKFFRADVELNIPIYLEPRVAEAVREHARRRNTNMGSLVNEWLRTDLLSEKTRRQPPARETRRQE